MNTKCQGPGCRHSRGVTMMEVLVTIVVMSIGLLGLAALQTSGLRINSSSGFRTTATLLANDIAERMRANPVAVYGVDKAFSNITSAALAAIDCTVAPAPICSDYEGIAAANCVAADMAAFDLNVWWCGNLQGNPGRVPRSGVANTLPNASASIVCNDANLLDADVCTVGSPHVITVTWTEKATRDDVDADIKDAEGNTTQNVILTVVP